MDSKAKSAIRTAETIGVLLVISLLVLSRCAPALRVDVAPPMPQLVEKPASVTHEASAHFRYIDAEARATFQCSLDGVHLSPCLGVGVTYEHLRPGRHVFKVVAQMRQFLSEPKTWTWIVVATGAPRPGHPAPPSAGPSQPAGASTHTGGGSQGPIGGGSQPQNGRFTIKGNPTGSFSPGVQMPIDLTFTNPFAFPITITSVAVTVRPETTQRGEPNPACSGLTNLVVVRAFAAHPIVGPDSTASLVQLGVPRSQWPVLRMPDLPVNQDACKNTTFALAYTGSATGS